MRRSRAAIFVLTMACAGVTHAESGVIVVGSVDFAFKELTLTPGQSTSLNPSLITLNPGVTIAYRGFYATANYDRTIGAQANVSIDDSGLPNQTTISRDDSVLTLGYRVTDSISVFGGWFNGDVSAIITGTTRTAPATTAFFAQDISYLEKGPFVGVGYSYTFGDKGTLGISVGYANLNGELSEIKNTVGQPLRAESREFDVTGFSYGLTWSGTLTGSLGYRAGVKFTRYEGEATAVNPVGIEEKYSSFSFGIFNYF